MKPSWKFDKSTYNSIRYREEKVNLGQQASAQTHTHASSKNTFVKQPLIMVNFSWEIEKYDRSNTARVRRFLKIKEKMEKTAVAAKN